MSGTQTPSPRLALWADSALTALWDSLHNYADDAATEEKREAARAVLADLQGELVRRGYTFAAGVVPTPPKGKR